MDEQEQTFEAPAVASELAASEAPTVTSGSPLARPLPVYVVRGRLEHDGVVYLDGQTFAHPDEGLIAQLRRAEALALPEELASAEDLAHQAAAREAQLQQQRDEIEALRRQIAVLQSGKGGMAPKGK